MNSATMADARETAAAPADRPTVATSGSPRSRGVSVVDITFAFWVIVIPMLFGYRLINSDGDLARHLTMGEYMLRHGRITTDQWSFTRAGEPYLTYEWLSQVLLALLHRVGGIAAVTIGAGLLIATGCALVVFFLRRRGVDPLLAWLTGTAVAVFGSGHWIARPHLFTFVALALLLPLMEAGDRGWRAAWPFLPLFAIWANLHPGFISGLIFLGAYAAGDVAEIIVARDRAPWIRRLQYHGAGLALGVVAMFLTPAGVHLPGHIGDLLGNDYIMAVTAEFQSPDFHEPGGKLFLVTILGVMALLTVRTQRMRFPRLFLLLITVAMALMSRRNISIFGTLVLPMLALEADFDWRELRIRGLVRARAFVRRLDAGSAALKFAPGFAVLMAVLAVMHGTVAGEAVVIDHFDEANFPVEAVRYARASHLDGRLLTEMQWGGYILYAWPGQRIFIDGMTDFFGDELLREYVDIFGLVPGWDRKLDEQGITSVLLRPGRPLAYALGKDGRWQTAYSDSTAALFVRPRADRAQ